VAGAAAKM